jgi:CMP-N-acetylneuraminic acid synthetase/sugar phosphate isomerase/epimerase
VTVVAVVPARGGSKGIPRKNLRLLGGVPLVVHAVHHAQAAKTVERVIVSTDDEEIANVVMAAGAEVPFLRPPELATDTADDLGVFLHLLEYLKDQEGTVPDLLVQVRATSPIRRPEVIDLAVRKLQAHREADSLRSISPATQTPYKMWVADNRSRLEPVVALPGVLDPYDMPRQRLPDVFIQDGLVDVIRSSSLLAKRSMAGDHILGLLHPEPAIDIDDISDLVHAQQVQAKLATKRPAARPEFGIIQGRLTHAWNGQLQCFPRNNWPNEFVLAAKCGLRAIELVVDREHNPNNPLWSAGGRTQLKRAAEQAGVRTYSVCIDYVIQHDLRLADTVQYVELLIAALAEIGAERIVLPLFEASDLSGEDLVPFVGHLRSIADSCRRLKMDVCLETALPAEELYEFLGMLARSNIAICYDIGNATGLGYDTAAEISLLGTRVRHVHIKDKIRDGTSVPLGEGDANFRETFAELERSGYEGLLIFETPRGEDPVVTAERNLAYAASAWDQRDIGDHIGDR